MGEAARPQRGRVLDQKGLRKVLFNYDHNTLSDMANDQRIGVIVMRRDSSWG
ncbi:hypothetical protein ACFQYP_17815 [Nonomuraea antimicrobica]